MSNISPICYNFFPFPPGSILSNLIFCITRLRVWPEEQGEELGDELWEKVDHWRRWARQSLQGSECEREWAKEREKPKWESEQGLERAGSLKGRVDLGGVLKAGGVLAPKNTKGFSLGNCGVWPTRYLGNGYIPMAHIVEVPGLRNLMQANEFCNFLVCFMSIVRQLLCKLQGCLVLKHGISWVWCIWI